MREREYVHTCTSGEKGRGRDPQADSALSTGARMGAQSQDPRDHDLS